MSGPGKTVEENTPDNQNLENRYNNASGKCHVGASFEQGGREEREASIEGGQAKREPKATAPLIKIFSGNLSGYSGYNVEQARQA